MTGRALLGSLLFGAAVLPYATLWVSRSGHVRARAVRFARTGWHRYAAITGAGSALYTLASSGGGTPLPTPPVTLAWAVVTLSFALHAHVEVLVAAEAMRAYPDDRALHYDLPRPRTWLATSARIVSAWGWVMRARHPLLAPAFLVCALGFALGPALLPGGEWVLLALAADCLVLGGCCLPWPPLDRGAVRTLRGVLATSIG